MIADVLNPSAKEALETFVGGPPPAFPVEIPEWVPAIIERSARGSFGDFRHPAGHDAMLVRLTTDPRMQAVWAHLTRKRRLDGRFLQPTRFTRGSTADDPVKRQDWAMLWLFCWVLDIAESRPRALLRREVEEKQEERRTIAAKLWAEAETLAYLEELGQGDPGQARVVSEAGGVLWRLSRADSIGDIVVERDRHGLETRAVATAISGVCLWLFGEPLYALTATLTSVALDCEVTRRQVREWWSQQPIQPSADKGSFFEALSAVCKPRA